jgi:hypothetical protein
MPPGTTQEASMTLAYIPFTIKILDFAATTEACPYCDNVCPRHDKDSRFPAEIDIDNPVLLQVIVGVYKCVVCNKFFRTPLEFINKGAHYTNRAKTKAIDSVDEDKMPFTLVAKRMERDFNVHPHATSVLRWYRDVTPKAEGGFDYNTNVVQAFSGILCVDEMYDGPFAVVTATDPVNNGNLAYLLVDEESVDKDVIKGFFNELKKLGIDPDTVITDDSKLYPEPLRKIWKKAKHQLCRFHFTSNVNKAVLKGIVRYRKKLPKKRNRRRGRPSKRGRPRTNKPVWRTIISKNRFLFVKRRENMSEKELDKLEEITSAHTVLATVRAFMDAYYDIFPNDEQITPRQARYRRTRILNNEKFRECPYLEDALALLEDKARFDKLITFLVTGSQESTSNDAERTNPDYRKRQKSHYRLRTARSMQAMLHRQLFK